MELIPLAISLITKYAPALLDRLVGDKAGDVKKVAKTAAQIINVGKQVTGVVKAEEIEATLKANPETAKAFVEATTKLDAELAREDTARYKAYLDLLKMDVQADAWYIKLWRPFNGYLFGITVFLDYMVMPNLIPWLIEKGVHNHIPEWVYIFWTMVLGVNGYTRGREKIEKIKINGGSVSGMKDVLKAVMS